MATTEAVYTGSLTTLRPSQVPTRYPTNTNVIVSSGVISPYANTLIHTGPCKVYYISAYITSADTTGFDLYDNTSAAGTAVMTARGGTDTQTVVFHLDRGIDMQNGIYLAEIGTATGAIVIGYSR